jgi:hypothetical protein
MKPNAIFDTSSAVSAVTVGTELLLLIRLDQLFFAFGSDHRVPGSTEYLFEGSNHPNHYDEYGDLMASTIA